MVSDHCITATRETYLSYFTEQELVWFGQIQSPCHICQSITNPFELKVMVVTTICSYCNDDVREIMILPCNHRLCCRCFVGYVIYWINRAS